MRAVWGTTRGNTGHTQICKLPHPIPESIHSSGSAWRTNRRYGLHRMPRERRGLWCVARVGSWYVARRKTWRLCNDYNQPRIVKLGSSWSTKPLTVSNMSDEHEEVRTKCAMLQKPVPRVKRPNAVNRPAQHLNASLNEKEICQVSYRKDPTPTLESLNNTDGECKCYFVR